MNIKALFTDQLDNNNSVLMQKSVFFPIFASENDILDGQNDPKTIHPKTILKFR